MVPVPSSNCPGLNWPEFLYVCDQSTTGVPSAAACSLSIRRLVATNAPSSVTANEFSIESSSPLPSWIVLTAPVAGFSVPTTPSQRVTNQIRPFQSGSAETSRCLGGSLAGYCWLRCAATS